VKYERDNYAAALRKKNRQNIFNNKRTKIIESEDHPTKYETHLNSLNPLLLNSKTTTVRSYHKTTS
jgi:hypothetical protein